MPFGFFKKNETADIIFMGGQIFTQNSDLPWAEAVACKDGLVTAVGDYEDLTELEGKNTMIVDLEGGFMLPGYIDTCGHPVLSAFKDSCLFFNKGDLENTLSQISTYITANPESEIYFGYGYEENIFDQVDQEQTRESLDQICSEKPVVFLGESGLHCWVNTFALDLVKAAAEEDEINTISLAYLLNVLEPMDSEVIPEAVTINMGEYCKRGFTSVFDCGAPEFFASLYQSILVHLYQENMVKQRFFGSLLISRNVSPAPMIRKLAQYRTHCVELNEFVNFDTLKLVIDRTQEAISVSADALQDLCLQTADNGFDIHIDALGKEAVMEAVAALEAARAAGYKKNAFTVAHDEPNSEVLENTSLGNDIRESPVTYEQYDDPWLCIKRASNIEEAIDLLTIDAAIQLGANNHYGSIEKGKHADFVIFNENPFELSDLSSFKSLQSVMTVVDGNIVYDAEEDDPAEWHAMLPTPGFDEDFNE